MTVIACASALSPLTFSKFVPPIGRTIVVMGQDLGSIHDYVQHSTILPAGYAAYTSLPACEGLTSEIDQGGGRQHAGQIASDHPHSILQLAIHVVNHLAEVSSGKLDSAIDRIALFVKSLNRPVYVRFGYEFDYPENHYEPAEYVKAYRHFVNRMRQVGVSNASYVWHSFAQPSQTPIAEWFPGDEYVDWCAVSYFDQGSVQLEEVANFSKLHGKPLMIAEAAPWHSKPSEVWEKWFLPMFAYVERHDVQLISYINCNWDSIPMFAHEKWGDSRLTSDLSLLAHWNTEICKPRFMNESSDLSKILSGG